MDCIFCAIAEGKIPSTKVYEDDMCLAFNDLHPLAPVHVIVIPKLHMESLNEVNESNLDSVAHIMKKIPEIAASLGLSEGYRVITNVGENGGQTVKHLHFHILGGAKLTDKLN